jgi:DNA polymerase III alpha subunit
MSLFGGINESVSTPSLKKEFEKLSTFEKLQKEFESFGFFLNDHPLDELTNDLKKRGIAFSNNIDDEQIADNSLIKMAGVVLSSKHRSSAKGRFAYLSLSDPMGIFEAMIFDENLITNSRDLLNDGSTISLECLIKKDEGGTRILVRSVTHIDNYIKNTIAKEQNFIDIKKQPVKKNKNNFTNNSNQKTSAQANLQSSSHSSSNKNNSPNIIVENEKKRIKALELVITNSEIIKPLKIIIDQKITDDQDQVEIYFMVKNQDQETKIKLANTYKIKDSDLIRFRNFSKNLTINVIYH